MWVFHVVDEARWRNARDAQLESAAQARLVQGGSVILARNYAEAAELEDDVARLAALGYELTRRRPSYDPRTGSIVWYEYTYAGHEGRRSGDHRLSPQRSDSGPAAGESAVVPSPVDDDRSDEDRERESGPA